MSFYTGHIAAASNRADWMFRVELIHPDDFVDFTTTTITVAVRPVSGGNNQSSSPQLIGTNQDGHITVVGPSIFEAHFTRGEMGQFGAGNLDMGITVLMDGNTYQLFSGQVPVIDGVVPL